MSMTGIDYFSAMLIRSEIGDITRFITQQIGIMVWIMSNRTSIWKLIIHGKNEEDGNKKIRWIMIQAANTAVRTDDRMKKYYTKIVKRHGHI